MAKPFRIPKREAVLIFEGDYEGAEVRCALNLPLGQFLELQGLAIQGSRQDIFEQFGRTALLSWNLETEAGDAIPADSEGMKLIPAELGDLIVVEWIKAVSQPAAPLSARSANGATSEEESNLRLADVSKSLGN